MAKYSEEFRNDAVALVRQGATQSQICKDLGISKSALSKWVTDADRTERGLPLAAEVSREEDAQIRELIKRNRLLEQENEVLRRAAAYLSQIHITPPK
ncbi:transposase [Leucobacter luti]|uniref:Transposase n=1 Tax=Leucobacter luti TaxID=340320 RepID=A0A4R6RYR4_9MICO|nr:transposase [Leucobacter luti]